MKKLTSIKELQLKANIVRQDIITMLSAAGSGHPGGSLGLADIFTALYFNILKHNPQNPAWEQRDRLILSNGHVCPARYAAMAEAGYFPIAELNTLRKLGTRLQGHPSRLDLPGLELSTASLGQGLGVAVGMALAAKLKKQKHKVYCITSDGEHDEGSTWEAVNAAQKYKLGNLINIIDRNNIQISGFTHEVWPLEPLKEKYRAFNWKVFEINGHDFKQILSAMSKAQKVKNLPVCIIAKTIPGKGVSFMENRSEWHGKTPNVEETKKALEELGKEKEKLLKDGFSVVFERDQQLPIESGLGENVEKTVEIPVEKTVEKIILLIKENPKITQKELSQKTGLTRRGVEWNLQQLKEKRLIKRVGPDKGGPWEVRR